MSSYYFTAKEYLKYRSRAVGAHDLHSPFVYTLYNQVLKDRQETSKEPLTIRREILSQTKALTFTDPKTGAFRTDTLRRIGQRASSSHKFSSFLIRLSNFLNLKTILETGTSLGLNAIYLAHSSAQKIVTIEGSHELAEVARSFFQTYRMEKVCLKSGSVNDTFAPALDEHKPDMIFLDADHRSETISMYLKAIRKSGLPVKCIVIHDVYWSPDMKSAWSAIIKNKVYNLTIDIFQAGLIFPDYPMEKQHFTLKF